jgi:ubiquinone/menaquinone biosynthesis C-methylase UbiE
VTPPEIAIPSPSGPPTPQGLPVAGPAAAKPAPEEGRVEFHRHFGAEAGSEHELADDAPAGDSVGEDSLASVEAEQHVDVEGAMAELATSFRAAGGPGAPAEPEAKRPASPEDVEQAFKDNRLAQVLYHDWEAGTYDEKWSISFDDRCISYARDRFVNLVGPRVVRQEGWPYGKALEIGAGTGFFSLNLRQGGVLDEVHVSDVSSGMVETAQANARNLGFEVTGTVSGAEDLPYPDDTFDVVVGHAVIHHIADVESALREILRVLRPGGRFVIAGEPTRIGDFYARWLGRITWEITRRVTHLPFLREKWARSAEELDASSRAAALESVVDLHTFDPGELEATARRAGAAQVQVQTEEFLAAFLGWPVRTFEATVDPKALGLGWAMFAYRSWLRLSAIDRVLSRWVPKKYFYNVGVTGTKPR